MKSLIFLLLGLIFLVAAIVLDFANPEYVTPVVQLLFLAILFDKIAYLLKDKENENNNQ